MVWVLYLISWRLNLGVRPESAEVRERRRETGIRWKIIRSIESHILDALVTQNGLTSGSIRDYRR